MKINVAGLLKSPVGTARIYTVDETMAMDRGGDLPIQGTANLLRTQKGILVSAQFQMQVSLVCSRCLGEFLSPLSVRMEEEFLPTVDSLLGGRLPPPEEEDTFTIGTDQVMDLKEACRQYAVLALPLKPLCHPDCPGVRHSGD